MNVVEQCPGCGVDVVIRRGPVEGRMCRYCKRAAGAKAKVSKLLKVHAAHVRLESQALNAERSRSWGSFAESREPRS